MHQAFRQTRVKACHRRFKLWQEMQSFTTHVLSVWQTPVVELLALNTERVDMTGHTVLRGLIDHLRNAYPRC